MTQDPLVDQPDFVSALLDASRPAPAGLQGPHGRPAGKRFDVYRNNVAFSLTRALETAFPVVRNLLGQTTFERLAGAYLRRHPPRSPLLMFYGEDLPAVLEASALVTPMPYLPDVARLELALRQSYHAADAAPIAPESLLGLPEDRLTTARLGLAPAVRLVRSRWPVYSIWRFNTQSDAPRPISQGENVLITRPGFDPDLKTLPRGGGTLVQELLTGAALGTAIQHAARAAPGLDPTPTLSLLIAGGAIVSIRKDTP